MSPAHRAAVALLAGVTVASALVGCTKTAAPATSTPSPPERVVASASADAGPSDFEEGAN